MTFAAETKVRFFKWMLVGAVCVQTIVIIGAMLALRHYGCSISAALDLPTAILVEG